MDNSSVECPHCGCKYCPVRHTIHRDIRWKGKTISTTRRYRICNHCKVPFTTVEHLEDENNIGFPAVKFPDPPPSPIKPQIKKPNPYLRKREE